MSDRDAPLSHLERQLWNGAMSDRDAAQRALREALDTGASYPTVLQGLRKLWRMALPGQDIAERARMRWPESIDIALLALDFASPDHQDEALAHLFTCVMQGNRRRAALANACARLNRPDQTRAALANIDPTSPTAADDMQRRIELALGDGDFDTARRDITWLEAQGFTSVASAMSLKLSYQQHGAAALADIVAQSRGMDARSHALTFDIFVQEGDYTRAKTALSHWQAACDTPPPALARAHSRFALERGDAQAAIAMLTARLDMSQPWAWSGVDHLQWLRAGLADQTEPDTLWNHCRRALRLHPRHDGLAHIALLIREAAVDWRALEPDLSPPPDTVEGALLRARAALRMGLNGRALGIAGHARRMRDTLRLETHRATAFLTAGRPIAAERVLERARTLARGALQNADIAVIETELALAQGKLGHATSTLATLENGFPDRMSLWLARTRLAFRTGDFAMAAQSLARFNALKAAQIGKMPAKDLRDMMIEDATCATVGVEDVFKPDCPVPKTIAKLGMPRISGSPALSAWLLMRAQAQGLLQFQSSPRASIPRQITHYWQGPDGPALARAQAQWRRLHPDCEFHHFDADSAADWLTQHYDQRMVARFLALAQPAARADLFRLCWIAQSGGVFADLDEYPRIPVTPWLKDARAVLCLEQGFGTIANNFIAAEAGHPISLLALQFACAALDQTSAPYPWWHSGPAQWTRAAFAYRFAHGGAGLRILAQTDYDRRVATNLPYPHKRSPEHWRG